MRHFIFSVIATLLLAGCTQLTTQPEINTQIDKTALPAPPEQWKITAKLGVKVPQQSGSVTLIWEQMDTSYRIRVQGPLGQGNAMIYGNEDRIVIKRLGKPLLTSDNANALIKNTFGWSFPLDELRFWIRGLPNPNSAITSKKQNASGTLEQLNQSNWVINYSRHQKVGQWEFPSKIVAQKEESRLTMIIRQWELL
ncbi:MAG: outer membrane lipoprotein LolB [Cellvibrionaceae bacterium]|jgi:outer membrane lipoprotein LolB